MSLIASALDDEKTPIEPMKMQRKAWIRLQWPWVSRWRLDKAERLIRAANDLSAAQQMDAVNYRKTIAQLISERSYMADQVNNSKTALETLRTHCNDLERKQRDLDMPPISSADLEKTLKRMSFLQTQNAELIRVNEQLSTKNREP